MANNSKPKIYLRGLLKSPDQYKVVEGATLPNFIVKVNKGDVVAVENSDGIRYFKAKEKVRTTYDGKKWHLSNKDDKFTDITP